MTCVWPMMGWGNDRACFTAQHALRRRRQEDQRIWGQQILGQSTLPSETLFRKNKNNKTKASTALGRRRGDRVCAGQGPAYFWPLVLAVASVSGKVLVLRQQRFPFPVARPVPGPRLVRVGAFFSSHHNPYLSPALLSWKSPGCVFHHLSTEWHVAYPAHTPHCIWPVMIGGQKTIHAG